MAAGTPFPTGTVTLVFTDIEGSTDLWERMGDAFAPWLERHNDVLRKGISAHGGVEVKTEGDAFMVAFAKASDAVRFALSAQEGLAAVDWPEPVGELRVRMGIHTGEPICAPDPGTGRPDYFGSEVNRAARIAGAAHGGQILLSESSHRTAAAPLQDAVVVDLGEHRLRGLERPEYLRQVLPKSLADRTFDAVRTLTALPTNLPAPTSTFIGREKEVRELAALFEDESVRLVTLSGPGGIGKTRLALRTGNELLDRFEGGCWFADLTEARDPAGIAHAVAAAFEVLPTGHETPVEAVGNILEYRKPLVLILDNFEQVADFGTETVGAWRSRAPHVRFLVTSRTLLGLAGEREFPLPPLAAPPRRGGSEGLAEISAYDGVRLFVERAREARAGFALDEENAPAVARICSELEGIPLAIELAAARIKILKPSQMADKLGEKFKLLKSHRRDLTPRQQTLLGAIEWSYDLLSEWEREAFLQASVFRGGFTLEAAEAAIDLSAHDDAPPAMDAVQGLCEKSLVRAADSRYETRFFIYLPIREYGEWKWSERADPDRKRALEDRHTAHYLEYAESWNDRIHTADCLEALDRLDTETDNLFAVQDRAIEQGDPIVAARAIMAIAETMAVRGPADQRVPRLERSLDALPESETEFRVRLLTELSIAFRHLGLAERTSETSERAVEGSAPLGVSPARARALRHRGVVFSDNRRYRDALDSLERSETLFRDLGIDHGLAHAISDRGNVHNRLGEYEKALACYREAETIYRRIGDLVGISRGVGNRGMVMAHLDRTEDALEALAESEEIDRKIRDRRGIAITLGHRGQILLDLGNLPEAEKTFGEMERLSRETGDKGILIQAMRNRGLTLNFFDRTPEAIAIFQEAVRIAREIGDTFQEVPCISFHANLLQKTGEHDEAIDLFAECIRLEREAGRDNMIPIYRTYQGISEFLRGDPARARETLAEAIASYAGDAREPTDEQFYAAAFAAKADASGGNPSAARNCANEAIGIAGRISAFDRHEFLDPEGLLQEMRDLACGGEAAS